MKLSHLQSPCWEGLSPHCYETKTRYQLAQIKTPVEPITKFCQVPVEVFLTDGMKCSSQRVLWIADNGVKPLEFRDFDTIRTTSADDCRKVISSSADGLP